MGGGSYSFSARAETTKLYKSQSFDQTFKSRSLKRDMDPKDVQFREARDSTEHPTSLPVIIALDVTGSMGSVPDHIVKDGLPKIVEKLIQSGIEHPQVLFLGIGDHECDEAPLQVGQFESSDALMDKWLTSVYMEKGGGANGGESYLLAWYFAKYHTKIDSFEKRGQKGFLFTIGDEPTLKSIKPKDLSDIMGFQPIFDQALSAVDLFNQASEQYEVFHVHTTETRRGSFGKERGEVDDWKEIAGQHLLEIKDNDELVDLITSTIVNTLSIGGAAAISPSIDLDSDDYNLIR